MADKPPKEAMMDKDRLKRLLSAKPVKVRETSFATQQLAKRVNEQQELIVYLAHCLSTQAASIIDLRGKMIQQKGAIETIADAFSDDEQAGPLIMPETKLVGFDR